MSKGKELALLDSALDNSIAKIRELHGIAMNAASQTTCAAIFTGLELRAVQLTLKKSTRWTLADGSKRKPETFEEFLDRNLELLGFSRATAFKYLKLADLVKGKLLKARDASLDRLLSLAPSQMTAMQAKTLLQNLHKSVDTESLSDLYEDFGITRQVHGASLRGAKRSTVASTPTPVTPEEKVQMQLDLFGRYSLSLDETITEGGRKILLVSKWPAPRLNEAIAIAKRNLALLVKIKNARA